MTDPARLGGDAALFFDFDGTLADIAEHPGAVTVHAALPTMLDALRRRCGGALAVVTGRPVVEVDGFLAPLVLPAAGVHGAERRAHDGAWQRAVLPDLAAATSRLQRWCREHPGARLEVKPGALALHYRGHDDLEEPARQAIAAAQAALDGCRGGGTVVLHGKKVVELKPAAADKGRAVRAFMAEPPFAGRRPWFFGDDVTDEAAFEVVQALGGVAVKVGEGASIAGHRLASPSALRDWLAGQLKTAAEPAAPSGEPA